MGWGWGSWGCGVGGCGVGGCGLGVGLFFFFFLIFFGVSSDKNPSSGCFVDDVRQNFLFFYYNFFFLKIFLIKKMRGAIHKKWQDEKKSPVISPCEKLFPISKPDNRLIHMVLLFVFLFLEFRQTKKIHFRGVLSTTFVRIFSFVIIIFFS